MVDARQRGRGRHTVDIRQAGSIAESEYAASIEGDKMAALNLIAEVEWLIPCASGAVNLNEAYQRYRLSAEKLVGWQEAIEAHGIGALRVTRTQFYRDAPIGGVGLRSGFG
jgi:hypothetical protein